VPLPEVFFCGYLHIGLFNHLVPGVIVLGVFDDLIRGEEHIS
jgi:hypothetical protein